MHEVYRRFREQTTLEECDIPKVSESSLSEFSRKDVTDSISENLIGLS